MKALRKFKEEVLVGSICGVITAGILRWAPFPFFLETTGIFIGFLGGWLLSSSGKEGWIKAIFAGFWALFFAFLLSYPFFKVFLFHRAYFLLPIGFSLGGLMGRFFPQPREKLVLFLFLLAYVIYMTALSWKRMEFFIAGAFDLGIFDQALWLIRHGKAPFVTVRGMHILGDHFRPILYPLSLLYFFWEDPRSILLFQTLLIASGAIPVYELTALKVRSRWLPLSLSLAYLLNPALQWMNWFDFHALSLATPLILWLLLYVERGKLIGAFIFALLSLSCRQDVSFALGFLGLLLMMKRGRRKFGLGLFLLSGGWSLLSFKIMAELSGYPLPGYIVFFKRFGRTPSEIVKSLLNPLVLGRAILTEENARYLRQLLTPLLFLPLLRLDTLIPALPPLFINMLGSREAFRTIRFQYTALITPFIFWSAISSLEWFKETFSRGDKKGLISQALVGSSLVISSLLTFIFWGPSPYKGVFLPKDRISVHRREIKRMLGAIPAHASVSAQANLVPHLSHREKIYMFPNPFLRVCFGPGPKPIMEQEEPILFLKEQDIRDIKRALGRGLTDYIVLAPLSQRKGPFVKESYRRMVCLVLSNPRYGIVAFKGGVIILRKGANFRQGLKLLGIKGPFEGKRDLTKEIEKVVDKWLRFPETIR